MTCVKKGWRDKYRAVSIKRKRDFKRTHDQTRTRDKNRKHFKILSHGKIHLRNKKRKL